MLRIITLILLTGFTQYSFAALAITPPKEIPTYLQKGVSSNLLFHNNEMPGGLDLHFKEKTAELHISTEKAISDEEKYEYFIEIYNPNTIAKLLEKALGKSPENKDELNLALFLLIRAFFFCTERVSSIKSVKFSGRLRTYSVDCTNAFIALYE